MKYEPIARPELLPKVALQLLENPFNGIIITLGEVSFSEDGDQLKMHYDYDVIEDNGKEYTKEALEKEIGDVIIASIEQGLEDNSLIYSGGTDGEDREDNFIKSDSQRGILP